jgi:hypothetical protein
VSRPCRSEALKPDSAPRIPGTDGGDRAEVRLAWLFDSGTRGADFWRRVSRGKQQGCDQTDQAKERHDDHGDPVPMPLITPNAHARDFMSVKSMVVRM